MANIPVERETSRPWWIWLLGALLLGLLIWLLIGLLGDDEEEVAAVDPVETVTPPIPGPAGPIESDLNDLYVTRVTGDRTFYVSPSAENTADETLIVLDQEMSPDVPGIEGQVDINPGQVVDLTGAVYAQLGDIDYTTGFSPEEVAMFETMDATTEVVRVDGDNVAIDEADLENVEVGE